MRARDIQENMKYRYHEIIKAVSEAARLYGVKQLAAEMCPPDKCFESYYTYLQSKLTVTRSSSNHYLTADELITIVIITGDLTAFRMMAEIVGCKMVPRKIDVESRDRMSTVMKYAASTAGTQQVIAKAASDGEINDREMDDIAAHVRGDEELAAEVIITE